jgi:low temperature requirement protein LtrA
MLTVEARARLFRQRGEDLETRVTPIELFFDLVFVFAVTQLSHRLLDHLTIIGAVETLILFLAIWWLWVYTSWATNWLDPDRGLVRAVLIVMMLGGLALASVVPSAFGSGGWLFATIYVVLQVGRTIIMLWASRGHFPGRARNFQRIIFYFLLSTPFWAMGAMADAEARLLWWAAAIAIEYAGPFLMFYTPGLGPSHTEEWDISGAHMAERCGLFIIIALGEAILVTGATFAKLTPDEPTIAAFATSFIGSAAMWWIYFDTGAKRAGEAIEEKGADAGRIGRNAYTYLHMPIVAGIVVTAVGDELMLSHPLEHADLSYVLVTCGGPFLFLIGNQMFKWTTAHYYMPPLSHFAGMLVLVGVGIFGLSAHWTPLTIGMAATGALILTAVWEWFSINGGWRRWTPWIGPRAAIALEESER